MNNQSAPDSHASSFCQTVDEKQLFVKPTLHPTLTDECEKATGIGQLALETAVSFDGAVQVTPMTF